MRSSPRRGIERLAVGALVLGAACGAFEADVSSEGPLAEDAGADDASDAVEAGGDVLAREGGADRDLPCPAGAFCDDFDDGELGAAWSSKELDRGALSLDSTNARSVPYALRAQLDSAEEKGKRQASLQRLFGKLSVLDCSFHLYVAGLGGDGRARPLWMYLDDPLFPKGYELNFWLYSDGMGELAEWGSFSDGGSYYYSSSKFGVPADKWLRMRLVVAYADSAKIWIDGNLVGSTKLYPRPTGAPKVNVGLRQEDGKGDWSVLVDDVVCVPTP